MSWTRKVVDGAPRYIRDDGCRVFRLQGGITPEWYYKTRTGSLSWGPFDSARIARNTADRLHRERKS